MTKILKDAVAFIAAAIALSAFVGAILIYIDKNSREPWSYTPVEEDTVFYQLEDGTSGMIQYVPGMIVILIGQKSDLEKYPNWSVCDGNNGRPDLTSCETTFGDTRVRFYAIYKWEQSKAYYDNRTNH